MIKKTILFLLFPTLAFAQQDTVALRFSKNISKQNLEKNLRVLASDEYEGRETGEKGQKMAAKYIAEQFQAAGIPAYKNNSYYQEFPLNLLYPSPIDITIKGKKYTNNSDYFIFPGQAEQTIGATEIVFLGYGIKDSMYDDYASVNVKDKIIMVMDSEPYNKDSTSFITGKKQPSMWTFYGRNKTIEATEAGAKAMFIVVEDIAFEMKENKHRLEKAVLTTKKPTKKLVVVYISKKMADEILKKATDRLEASISKSKKPKKVERSTEIKMNIKEASQSISSENVLGYVEGTDLKNELIVITAHYDHLGKEGSVVYNGADDDGSGTVAVIELAKTFAQAKKEGKGPRRSMLFMAVSGEEKGLLGSAYYVNNPEFPLANTVCNLNIDMIGRMDKAHENNPDYVYLIGSDKLSSELHNISEKANKAYINTVLDYTYNDEKDKNRFYYRSDHYNFAKNGIPVIFYFNGVHADYHQETDEVEKIHFGKIENITRLVFFTAWELANRTERIKVDSNKK